MFMLYNWRKMNENLEWLINIKFRIKADKSLPQMTLSEHAIKKQHVFFVFVFLSGTNGKISKAISGETRHKEEGVNVNSVADSHMTR